MPEPSTLTTATITSEIALRRRKYSFPMFLPERMSPTRLRKLYPPSTSSDIEQVSAYLDGMTEIKREGVYRSRN
jgi:hypothetical protein